MVLSNLGRAKAVIIVAFVMSAPLAAAPALAADQEYYDIDGGRDVDGDVDPGYRSYENGARDPVAENRAPDYDDDAARRGSVKDNPYLAPPRVTQHRPDPYDAVAARCVHPRDIKRGLRYDGWRDFDDFDVAGDFIFLTAERRGDGQDYILQLDRCSGAIVNLSSSDDDDDYRRIRRSWSGQAGLPYRSRFRDRYRRWQ